MSDFVNDLVRTNSLSDTVGLNVIEGGNTADRQTEPPSIRIKYAFDNRESES